MKDLAKYFISAVFALLVILLCTPPGWIGMLICAFVIYLIRR